MPSQGDMPKTSPSKQSLTEEECASVAVAPILNFIESVEDALDAFPPEEPLERYREAGNQADAASLATSNAAPTLRLHLEPDGHDIQRKDRSHEDRSIRPPIVAPRPTVPPAAVHRPTFLTAILTAVTVSLAIVLVVVVVRYFEPGDVPSVVATVPELQAVPTASVTGTNPAPPNSTGAGDRTSDANAGSQTKSIVAPKTATTVATKSNAITGSSRPKSAALSSRPVSPKPSSAVTPESRGSAARDRIVPVTPTAPGPGRVDRVTEAVGARASETPPASASSTNSVASNSAAAAVPPVVPSSGVSASVATVAPPIAEAAPTAASAVAGEEVAVRNVLSRYRSAYQSLNVNAAKGVWPSVDAKALSRAFAGLQSQQFDFSECQIALDNNRATAACGGTARFVPKVGNRSERVEFRRWTFQMRKADEQWTIAKVDVR